MKGSRKARYYLTATNIAVISMLSMGASCAKEPLNESGYNRIDFEQHDGAISRVLQVRKIDQEKIAFYLKVDIKGKDQNGSIDGIAIRTYGDPEIIEDEEGNTYPADQYIYSSNTCWMSVKIESVSQKIAMVTTSKCALGDDLDAAYGSDRAFIREIKGIKRSE